MKQRWKVLLVTSVAVFMGFLDVTIVNIAFPDIVASFPGTSLAGLSWILNAYNIVFAALLVPAGRLADRLGRRRMFFVGVSTFLAASAAVRAGAVGRGAGRRARRPGRRRGDPRPDLAGLLLPEFPLEQRATATALWGATGGIAAATGPALGGVLVDGDELALGLLRQPRHRPAGPDPGAARCCARAATRDPGPLSDILGHRPARRRRRPAVAGDRQGPRLGLGQRAASSARSPPPRSRCRLPRALGAPSGAR